VIRGGSKIWEEGLSGSLGNGSPPFVISSANCATVHNVESSQSISGSLTDRVDECRVSATARRHRRQTVERDAERADCHVHSRNSTSTRCHLHRRLLTMMTMMMIEHLHSATDLYVNTQHSTV